MPPMTTSTSALRTSLVAAVSATASSVALSSTYSSTGRPSRPPQVLMSSMTILATLALAMPMKDSAPVWSVIRPTRAGRSMGLIVARLRPVLAEQRRYLRLAEVPGLLQDGRDLGVGHEARPPLLIPVEQDPHPVLLGRVAKHGGALRPVQGPLVGARGAEHLQELLDVGDGGG